ncbi:Protein ZINC INDUCED FACILITATOR-LIKE 1 [Durusdinium trenchii]|uniref:Protein ZINC INDUCED FACILITATOR-LIKE 1 n=1 Tax=Durusdinium trenchii TaxID=1381693 RepID=A0ABP0JPN9_9DINO
MLPLTPKHIPNRPSSHGIPLGAGISALRLGKGVRVLRVFRLIRVLKGGGILQELLDTIHSEHCIIIVGIVKLLALILCVAQTRSAGAAVLAQQPSGLGLPPRTEVNHIIACLWFWVGSSEHAVNWISEAEEERTFTVCVIVSAMVIFSSFISAITNAMTQLRNLNKEKIEQFSLLRKYLTQCNVSGGLLARVLQSMSSAMNKNKRRVHEEDIKVLHLLPLSLRQDMNQEVYSPHFVVHPFFSVCASCFDTYVRKLYSAGLRTKFVPSNQEIITSGEQAGEIVRVAADGTTEVICQSDPVDSPVGRKVLYWKTERSLAPSPKHTTHETDHVFQRVKLTTPVAFLKEQWRAYYDQFAHDLEGRDATDFLHLVAYVDLPNLRAHAATEAWQALTGFDGEDQGRTTRDAAASSRCDFQPGMNYKSDRQLSPLPVTIQEGTWLAEASLWLQWQHNGLGNTVTECDVLVLDAAKFQEIFKDDVTVKHYAVAFWEHFMSNPADLTDAWADEDLLFQWSTEALQTAEQSPVDGVGGTVACEGCMGSVIEPDHRNTAFSRHVTQKRRSSSAMLDETILKERRVPVAPVAEHHSGARRLEPSSREPLPDMAWFLILQRCHK